MISGRNAHIGRPASILGPVGWLLIMADSGIPDKLLPAVRLAVFWIALPFILLLTASDRYFVGTGYEVAACIAGAFSSIMIAVYWDRLIPSRFRKRTLPIPSLKYLDRRDSSLGSAISSDLREKQSLQFIGDLLMYTMSSNVVGAYDADAASTLGSP
jgi:hypothetical protein